MEEIRISDDVFEQIKDFNHYNITEERKLLIDKLILKERYKKYGLCKECRQPYINKFNCGYYWCQSCSTNHFQQNFKNWTNGNHVVDKFIQEVLLNAKDFYEALEWIEYDKFEAFEYLAKGGFGTTYKAIWEDECIEMVWILKKEKWKYIYTITNFGKTKEMIIWRSDCIQKSDIYGFGIITCKV
ncbi:uncharacterized protein OCT59_016553 [Rhizophagus irregularis]|uniref:Protein kinase domain-containing protein n=1 Tax=Rhizophagus irregularis (strain DAOM 181602 / DAOM 197198 / MUCL 43194) TaxID=747089 RepID=U9U6F0_RHIID|nr:hypothetical protein OCT59_016553 [Rhizophagus irregularis]GBC15211.1 kinase-like domain-containing protein [Rhizophagus irregularis DAOM 181602=DAOM 197198]